MGFTLLQAPEVARQVLVDARGSPSSQGSQASPPVATCPHGSITRRKLAALHRCDYSCRKHSYHGGTFQVRPCLRSAEASLLRQWSTFWIQGLLPFNLETTICNPHYIQEAMPLLRQVQDLFCYWFQIGKHSAQSRCHWMHLQVGSRTGSSRDRPQAKNCHHVASSSREIRVVGLLV